MVLAVSPCRRDAKGGHRALETLQRQHAGRFGDQVRLALERADHAIAMWLRDKGASWAEWVCPELKDQDNDR